jgi:hypothetical protein
MRVALIPLSKSGLMINCKTGHQEDDVMNEREDLVFYTGIRDSLADVIRYLNIPDDSKIEAYLDKYY